MCGWSGRGEGECRGCWHSYFLEEWEYDCSGNVSHWTAVDNPLHYLPLHPGYQIGAMSTSVDCCVTNHIPKTQWHKTMTYLLMILGQFRQAPLGSHALLLWCRRGLHPNVRLVGRRLRAVGWDRWPGRLVSSHPRGLSSFRRLVSASFHRWKHSKRVRGKLQEVT